MTKPYTTRLRHRQTGEIRAYQSPAYRDAALRRMRNPKLWKKEDA